MSPHLAAAPVLIAGSTDWWTAGPTIALAAIAVLAFGVAWRQVWSSQRDARVDRTIALHRDMTTGETQSARRRLAGVLWYRGTLEAERANVCLAPAWSDFLPGAPGVREAGWLATYPYNPEVVPAEAQQVLPLDDFYVVLSCFERLAEAFYAKTLAEKLVVELFAWDVCWWRECFRNIQYSPETGEGDTPRIGTLSRLADTAHEKQWLTAAELERLKHNFAKPDDGAVTPP